MNPIARHGSWLLLGLIVLLTGQPSWAEEALNEEAYAEANAALVENHVLPRYRGFEAATADFAAVSQRYCADPSKGELEAVRARYNGALDAWMAVQHLRFGPSELFLRAYRIAFWPQAQGRFAELVAELLAEETPEKLTQESFSTVGVAVQGFPAAEILLHDGTGLTEAADGRVSRCDLLRAIAGNLSGIASEIRREWQDGAEPFRKLFAHPGQDNPYFASHRDATLMFFKALHDELQLIVDVKLKPALGESAGEAQPKLLESPLSGRALRNIRLNLAALEGLYLGEGGAGLSELVTRSSRDPELDPLMRKAFGITRETARTLDEPLAEALSDPELRPRVEKLLTQVTALKQIVKTRVAAALGVSVGFNALDGD